MRLSIYILSGLFSTLFSLAAPAQRDRIDSLQKVLPTLHDTARINCLNALAFSYLDMSWNSDSMSYIDSASHYALQTLDESKRINFPHGIALALLCRSGITKHSSNNYMEMARLVRESLQWFERTRDKRGIETAYHLLGFAVFAQSRFDESIQYLELAYKYNQAAGNLDGEIGDLSLIGEAYRERGDYDRAFDYTRKCLRMATDAGNKREVESQLFMIGELYTRIEDYTSALKYFRQALQMHGPGMIDLWTRMEYAELFSRQQKYDSAWNIYSHFDTTKAGPIAMRFYLVSLGEFYFQQQEYDKALYYFQRGLAYHRQSNDRNQIMRALLDIARTYAVTGQDAAAIRTAYEGLTMADRTRARQYIRDGCQILSSLYDRKGLPDSAYPYYRRYISMKDSIVSNQVKGKFAAYDFEQQIHLLNKEKQIQQIWLQKESLTKDILAGGIVILLLLGFIIFRNVTFKRRNEAHRREQAENELQIQKLESERSRAELQQQAAELEMKALRSQINPHFIFNCLGAINRFILKDESEAASDYLTKFSRLIRMVLNNSRYPTIPLEDEIEVLRLYLDMERLRFKDAFDYRIILDEQAEEGDIFIPPLLLQPFVENAVWHGLMHKEGRGLVSLTISTRDNMLTCVIEDNGVGRRKAAMHSSQSNGTHGNPGEHKSMGMQITSERLALLNSGMVGGNGQKGGYFFEIEDLHDATGEAAGTRVTLKIRISTVADETPVNRPLKDSP